MSIKILLAGAGVLLVAGAVPFCAWGQTGSAPSVTLHVEADATSATGAMEKLTEAFTRETGIGVAVEKFGYKASMQTAVEDIGNKAGHFDLIVQNTEALAKFAPAGAIYSVDELEKLTGKKADFEDDLYAEAWKNLSWYKGTRYGYPLAANTMVVVYRKDLFEDPQERQAFQKRYGYTLGTPQDWKQYKDVANFFTRPGQGLYGTLIQGKHHPAVWFEWLNFAFSFGGGVMEKERAWEYGPIIINSPQTIQATEFYSSLKQFSPPGAENFTWEDAGEQMRAGHVAMCIMWSDAIFSVEDPKKSTVAGKVGFARLPAGPAGRVAQIAGATYFVSRYAQHPKEAFVFELWMLGKDRQVQQELTGGSSPRKSVYLEKEVQTIPYAPAIGENLGVVRAMIDAVPETPLISDVIEGAVNDVVAGKKLAKQSLDEAAGELKGILGEKAVLKYPASTKN